MQRKVLSLAAALAGTILPAASTWAVVKVPPVISDHMVLQRDMPVPIWGTAAAGEKVTVKFRDQEKTTEPAADGKWIIKLDALKVGEKAEALTIAGSNTITIQDVLVGDVWVGSGQSNMAMGTTSYTAKDAPLAKNVESGPYPMIRIITSGGHPWQEATPDTLKGFSAMLFSFGLPLQKEVKIPVGLMVGAVGGTPSGAWLSADALQSDAACQSQIKEAMAGYDPQAVKQKYDQQLAEYEKNLAAANAKATASAKAGVAPQLPRKPVMIGKPGEMPGGRKPGYLYDANIKPYQPFAIRGVLWDQGESGTAIEGVDQYAIMGALIHGWRVEWGQGDFPFIYIQKPSGGGCALDPKDPLVAAANPFTALPPTPSSGNEGHYRELHIKIQKYPNTFMVTSSDLGSGTHPIFKSSYGIRACQVALGAVYGKAGEFYGPTFDAAKIDGDKIRVSFTHVGQGLVAGQNPKLQGFSVAGEDKKFYWADATIDGNAVVVHSDKVANPVAVRYAWGAAHPWANLFNKDGLPAQLFRSDSW